MNDDFDELFSDLRQPEPERKPEPQRPEAAPKSPKSAKSSTVLPWVIVGVVSLLLLGGVAFAFFGQGDSDASAPVSSSTPSPSESPSAEPEPETPAPAEVALPTACVELFSPAYFTELSANGATLSEGNTGPREYPFEADVPELVESTIAEAPHLECAWRFPNEFYIGINTVVAEVSDEEATAIEQALAGAGFAAVSELGSTRYIKEIPGSEGFGPKGFSIIARDGLLIATEWLDWPASGYTADIVNTVLGPAQ